MYICLCVYMLIKGKMPLGVIFSVQYISSVVEEQEASALEHDWLLSKWKTKQFSPRNSI